MSELERRLYRVRPAFLASWLKHVFGVRRRLVTTKEGLQLFLDPVSHMGREILETGTYEPDLVDILQKLLRPGDTFFDAGMNEGFFACLAAKIVGPSGRVVGAEPQKRLIPLIQQNFALNQLHNCRVEGAALAEHEGSSMIFLAPSTNSGGTSFYRHTRGSRPQLVRTTSVDALWDKARLDRVRFMKVDVEGAEGNLLAGAQLALAQQRLDFLMVEFHPQLTGPLTPKAIDTRLRQAGYELTQIGNGGWIYHLPALAGELERLSPVTRIPPLA